jgi:alpha-mannosidase
MARQPLHYTFANHAHWVGRTWLRGHGALASSLRDMLALAREGGVRGNVDCDGAGWERLAADSPQVLGELRAALADGTLEVVGGTYGQPIGLFQGGESNLRQRLLGARAVRRVLGVWPRNSWTGTFEFFPQLPQLLAGCGYEGACLFVPELWSTPELPVEEAPLVLWEGLDGTRLRCLPVDGNGLQPWPAALGPDLDLARIASAPRPALLHWVDLSPDPDWICRSELLLPRLRELARDPRFELLPVTLGGLIAAHDAEDAPVRAWTLDDVFHGVSLGKNADCIPRFSRTGEEQLLAAESLSALMGLFGRPYASWDVYPHWELEEAWKDLCAAQHHDVHELEGLCGAIGERFFEKSLGMGGEVFARTLEHLALRVDAPEGATLVYNTLGWTRDVALSGEGGGGIVRDVPAYGYRAVDPYDIEDSRLGSVDLRSDGDLLSFERRHFRVEIDRNSGLVTQIYSREFPEGLLHPERPVGELTMTRGGKPERFERVTFEGETAGAEEWAEYTFLRESASGSRLRVVYGLAPLHDALWVRVVADPLERPDGGMHAGLSMSIAPRLAEPLMLHDHPFAITRVRAERDARRSYPTGDWLTSERVEERVRRPFTASSLVDLCSQSEAGAGLLVVHDGSQAWFAEEHGVRCLLAMYDPWDEDYFDAAFEVELALVPHGRMSNTARMRTSMELNLGSPRFADHVGVRGGGDLPPAFGALAVDAPNVLASSLARASARDAEHLEGHFAARCGARDPYVVRLVEYDGRPADVVLRLPGSVAAAARTDHLGRVLEMLEPSRARAPFGPRGMPWSAVRLSLRPREVATLMFDLELGRQVPRAVAAAGRAAGG